MVNAGGMDTVRTDVALTSHAAYVGRIIVLTSVSLVMSHAAYAKPIAQLTTQIALLRLNNHRFLTSLTEGDVREEKL